MSNDSGAQLLADFAAANRAYQRAVDEMDEAVTHHLGVNRSDTRCIDILEERGPMPAGELATAAGLSPGAITTLMDRLERQGYVRRVRDPDDRRRVLVELTDAARRAIWELYGPLAEGEPWFHQLTADQITVIRDFLRRGAELNLEHAARVRAMPAREHIRRRGSQREP